MTENMNAPVDFAALPAGSLVRRDSDGWVYFKSSAITWVAASYFDDGSDKPHPPGHDTLNTNDQMEWQQAHGEPFTVLA